MTCYQPRPLETSNTHSTWKTKFSLNSLQSDWTEKHVIYTVLSVICYRAISIKQIKARYQIGHLLSVNAEKMNMGTWNQIRLATDRMR